jgi:hypothetical protein
VKCIRCDKDCTYPQRKNKKCPNCGGTFAFEPRERDPINDVAFKKAIDAVSSQGQVRFGVEHLYYEVCRRSRPKLAPVGCIVALLVFSIVLAGIAIAQPKAGGLWLFAVAAWVISLVAVVQRLRSGYVSIDRDKFSNLYDRWCAVHETPRGVIVRRDLPGPPPTAEPDLADYSFDRAVICDRARTVDVLLANNFHFENNCAVLSVDGYPRGPFATVKAMLKRNPRLQVFVLHDATLAGCRLASQLTTDPEWFAEGFRVIDLGLRPKQAERFHGMFQPASRTVLAGDGITEEEAKWLSAYTLELAAVRPEQLLKRLFAAVNRTPGTAETAAAAAAGTDGGGGWEVDAVSMSSEAGDSDGGFDAFG